MPVVQLTAADTDKDGYDELVITAGLNDTYGYNIVKNLGAGVPVRQAGGRVDADLQIRALGGRWDCCGGRCPRRAKAAPLCLGRSSVGNVLASDDSLQRDGIFRRSSRRA